MMNTKFWPVLLAFVLPLSLVVGDEPPPRSEGERYAALSRLIHKAVLARLPKVFADDSNWGQSIPVPERLRRPNLRRAYVQVGDHQELPQGTWRKVRAWMDEPAQDLEIRVRSLEQLSAGNYRLALDASAPLHIEADVRQWLKGLLLADIHATADADLGVSLAFDVTVKLAGKLPPEVEVAPRLTDLKTELKRFTPRKITFRRANVTVEGAAVEKAGDDLKGSLQDLMHRREPMIMDLANEAITRALREGQGTLSAADLLKAATPPRPKD